MQVPWRGVRSVCVEGELVVEKAMCGGWRSGRKQALGLGASKLKKNGAGWRAAPCQLFPKDQFGSGIREGGNHGEEGRAGPVFTYTLYLYSRGPATPWNTFAKPATVLGMEQMDSLITQHP